MSDIYGILGYEHKLTAQQNEKMAAKDHQLLPLTPYLQSSLNPTENTQLFTHQFRVRSPSKTPIIALPSSITEGKYHQLSLHEIYQTPSYLLANHQKQHSNKLPPTIPTQIRNHNDYNIITTPCNLKYIITSTTPTENCTNSTIS